MTTKYLLKENWYNDCEGRRASFRTINTFDTLEDAIEASKKISKKPRFPFEGSWKIVAKTIDEESFTVTEQDTEYYFDTWSMGKLKEFFKD